MIAELTWRLAGPLLEGGAEIGGRGEAKFIGNVGDFRFISGQSLAGAIDAQPGQVFVGGFAKMEFETVVQAPPADPGMLRNLLGRQGLPQILAHELKRLGDERVVYGKEIG